MRLSDCRPPVSVSELLWLTHVCVLDGYMYPLIRHGAACRRAPNQIEQSRRPHQESRATKPAHESEGNLSRSATRPPACNPLRHLNMFDFQRPRPRSLGGFARSVLAKYRPNNATSPARSDHNGPILQSGGERSWIPSTSHDSSTRKKKADI